MTFLKIFEVTCTLNHETNISKLHVFAYAYMDVIILKLIWTSPTEQNELSIAYLQRVVQPAEEFPDVVDRPGLYWFAIESLSRNECHKTNKVKIVRRRIYKVYNLYRFG